MTHKKSRRTVSKAERRVITFIICIFLIGAIIGGLTVAAVSAFKGSEQKTQLSDKPYGTRDGRYITENGGLTFNYELGSEFEPLECALPVELQEFTYYLCEAYYIDFEFAMALMYTESSFRADVVSGTNDYGLMQINKCNHKMLTETIGVTDFLDPHQNIRSGIYILANLFEKYEDPGKVLMAYNMGQTGAKRLWDKGVHESRYSNKILNIAAEYEKQISEERGEQNV